MERFGKNLVKLIGFSMKSIMAAQKACRPKNHYTTENHKWRERQKKYTTKSKQQQEWHVQLRSLSSLFLHDFFSQKFLPFQLIRFGREESPRKDAGFLSFLRGERASAATRGRHVWGDCWWRIAASCGITVFLADSGMAGSFLRESCRLTDNNIYYI